MFDYQSIKLRLSPWIAFFVGGILVLWALVEKRSAVGFGDLYPGVALIAAGLLLLGFLNYLGRGPNDGGPPIQDSGPGSSAWGEAFKSRLLVFTVLMAVLCPAFLIWMASTTKRQLESYSWPEVAGTVESTTTKTWLSDQKVMKYFGRVVYRYTVKGQTYTTALTDLGPGTKRPDPQSALADVSGYHPGDNVAVYYDPDDPSIAVIEKGIPLAHLILLIALSVGSVVSITASIVVLRSWLHSRRRGKVAA